MATSVTREIGVGLISVGWMGKVHARAYQALPVVYPDLGFRPRLVIAADTSPERADYAREVLGFQRSTTDFRKVLADPEVDVVSICAPNFLHSEMAEAAARAGKAYWLEKPAGRNVEETEAIARATQESGVVSTIGFNYRHVPVIEHAKELIAQGRIGRVTNVRGAFFADYSADPRGALSWRFKRELAGSGVLGDLLGHLVDLMHYTVGPIERTTATTSTVHTRRPELPMGQATHFALVEGGEMGDVENEDYAGLLVQFGQDAMGPGAVGTLEASRVAVGPRAQYAIEVFGTEGSLSWDFQRMNELQLAVGLGQPEFGYTTIYAGPGHGDFGRFQPGAGTGMGYDDLKVVEARKFLQAWAGGVAENSSIQDAVASARVLDAAERSAASGQWESVEPVDGTTAARG